MWIINVRLISIFGTDDSKVHAYDLWAAQQQGHNTPMARIFSLANLIPSDNQMEDTNLFHAFH